MSEPTARTELTLRTHNAQEADLIGNLRGTHNRGQCAGRACVIHSPTRHHMRSWTLHWRDDRGIFERLCPDHLIGHPDPDQFDYWIEIGQEWQAVHGCCGDCVPYDRR